MATTFTWAGTSGDWGVNGDWVPSSGTINLPGSLGTDVVLFDGTVASVSTLSVGLNNAIDQMIVRDPNAWVRFSGSEDLLLSGNGPNSGLYMSAGTITTGIVGSCGLQTLQMNTGTITGGTLTIGNRVEVEVLNSGTFSLTGTGIITANGGELDIGDVESESADDAGIPDGSGQVLVDGGVALISGGSITATKFEMSSGTFTQSAGGIDISGFATFAAGTAALSGTALFQAGTVVVGTALSINGGTVQALSGGGGITIAAGTIVTMGSGATTSLLDGTNGGIDNLGTVQGQGVVAGVIAGNGEFLGSGGILDITSTQTTGTFNIDTLAASEVKFDGSSDSGGTVTFNSNTIGVLGIGNGTDLANFTDSVANLGIASTPTSVAGDNFINVNSAVTIGDIKVVGGTGNQFATGDTQFILYSDTSDTTVVGTITLASAPVAGTFVDWRPDATANGGALGGTDVFLANMVCYAAGTLIRTDRGDVAVEDLAAGDTVVTIQHGQEVSMPIKWMGVRQLDIAKHPHPHLAAPVRIRAGAFGDDLPRRDLLVSPAHAILADGKLVPANLLINNMTIVQDTSIKAITYHHIELDQHAIVLAEGLPAESYLDVGNRDFFSNAGLPTTLHPEFHANAGLKVWEEKGCAPLAIDVEDVAPIWRGLAERAESLGYTPPRFTTTQDADLYVEANGRRLRPVVVAKGKHTFMLPAGASDVVLHSRTAAPADLDPLTGDWRALGVAVRSMTVRSGDDHLVIPADHPALAQGWHTPETGNGSIWRWTNGNAAIPMVGTAGPVMLDIDVAEMGTYILARSDRDEQRLAA